MAEFSVLKDSEAPRPARASGKLTARMLEYEGYVSALRRGQAGRLVPAPGEPARGVALRVSRAGKRIGKPVTVWIVDGDVYFSLQA